MVHFTAFCLNILENNYKINVLVFRYELYAHRLPEFLRGQEFIDKYVNHDDSATSIDRSRSYAVRAPTKHPVFENFRVKVSDFYIPHYYYYYICTFFFFFFF